MTLPIVNLEDLEAQIRECLRNFYDRRINKLSTLKLTKLEAKNPYLFRALGVQNAAEMVEETLRAFISSSDETIFGEVFFEPLARFAASGGVATEIGMDIVIETEDTYTVIEMKSGSSWSNARQSRRIRQDFEEAEARFLEKGIQKQFRAILGQSTGTACREAGVGQRFDVLSGQAFWQFITGDPNFYLKLMSLMKDYPLRQRPDYQEAWAAAVNRLTREFLDKYSAPDGSIDWEKLTQVNSGIKSPRSKRNRR